jgi:hypothetical protein
MLIDMRINVGYNYILKEDGESISDTRASGSVSDCGTGLSHRGILSAGLLLHVKIGGCRYQGAYKTRSLAVEIVIAVLAAGAVSLGVFFLGLSVGIFM